MGPNFRMCLKKYDGTKKGGVCVLEDKLSEKRDQLVEISNASPSQARGRTEAKLSANTMSDSLVASVHLPRLNVSPFTGFAVF